MAINSVLIHKTEVSSIEEKLSVISANPSFTQSLSKAIHRWTSGIPKISNIICELTIQRSSTILRQLKRCPTNSTENALEKAAEKAVDKIVHSLVLKRWQTAAAAPHLEQIEAAIAAYPKQDLLLLLYLKIIQRGQLEAVFTAEQACLIDSGLVIQERNTLKVACQLYAHCFSLSWIEKQLPGITRPVTIIDHTAPRRPDKLRLSIAPKISSKTAIFFGGLAVASIAAFTYFKLSHHQQALATQTSLSSDSSPPQSDVSTDRMHYDQGMVHAENGRWLLMMREFCQLTPRSPYYPIAQTQLKSWENLYSKELSIAADTLNAEQAQSCEVTLNAQLT